MNVQQPENETLTSSQSQICSIAALTDCTVVCPNDRLCLVALVPSLRTTPTHDICEIWRALTASNKRHTLLNGHRPTPPTRSSLNQFLHRPHAPIPRDENPA